MIKRDFLLILLSIIGIALPADGQVFYTSQNFNIRNTYGYEIVSGLPADEIVVFQDRLFHYEMYGLDSTLQTLWKKRIQLDIGVSHVIAVLRLDTAICLILGYHQGHHSVIEAFLYDRRGEQISRQQLYVFTAHYDMSQMKWTESHNRKWGLIFFKSDDKTMRCLRIYLPALRGLPPLDIDFDTRQWRQQFQSAKITDHGFFAFAFVQTEGWLVKDERILLLIYGDTTNAFERFKWTLKDHYITDAFLERGRDVYSIHCVGVYTNARYQAEGYWSVTVHPTHVDTALILYPFTDEVRKKLIQSTKRKLGSAIHITHLINRTDGGFVIFGEMRRKNLRRTDIVRHIDLPSREHFGWTDYYYDDVIAMSIHPDWTIHWTEILYKRQFSQDDNAIYSSYFIMHNTALLRIIYNDNIERDPIVSEYLIGSEGVLDRRTLFRVKRRQWWLRWRDAKQTKVNEVLVPSQNYNILQLIKIRF